MYYVRWILALLVWTMIATVLHYTLPQHDVVRIVNTETRRIDFGENSPFWTHSGTGDAEGIANRDVFFLDTFKVNERPMVYRNEDTGWGWPPYFKLNAANLQARAADLVSTKADPQWVSVRHYGWRIEFLSVYPNALSVKPVDGPDHRVINWFNIIFLAIFLSIAGALWIRWRRFRESRIDPVMEDLTDSFEAAGESVGHQRNRFRRWLQSWRR